MESPCPGPGGASGLPGLPGAFRPARIGDFMFPLPPGFGPQTRLSTLRPVFTPHSGPPPESPPPVLPDLPYPSLFIRTRRGCGSLRGVLEKRGPGFQTASRGQSRAAARRFGETAVSANLAGRRLAGSGAGSRPAGPAGTSGGAPGARLRAARVLALRAAAAFCACHPAATWA